MYDEPAKPYRQRRKELVVVHAGLALLNTRAHLPAGVHVSLLPYRGQTGKMASSSSQGSSHTQRWIEVRSVRQLATDRSVAPEPRPKAAPCSIS